MRLCRGAVHWMQVSIFEQIPVIGKLFKDGQDVKPGYTDSGQYDLPAALKRQSVPSLLTKMLLTK